MGIIENKADGSIILQTKDCSYHMAVDRYGYLRHLYYGKKLDGEDLSYLYRDYIRGFAGNPYEADGNPAYSPDTTCREYTGCGLSDYRIPSLRVVNADGSRCADLRYVSHEIRKGKYSLPGLPAALDTDGDAQTLEAVLRDGAAKLTVRLLYGVLEQKNMITRAAVIENGGDAPVTLEKAASCCLELPFGSWDLMHFHGRHNKERI